MLLVPELKTAGTPI